MYAEGSPFRGDPKHKDITLRKIAPVHSHVPATLVRPAHRALKALSSVTNGMRHRVSKMKIISGGQTGVDRGALDAALEAGIECGGTCPGGRKAEDGFIPEIYPLTEFASNIYSDRTRQNVVDSDATLILHFGQLEGGTAFTRQCCIAEAKPYLVIDASEDAQAVLVQQIVDFIRQNKVQVLNVAGPRASKVPVAQQTTKQLLTTVLKNL
jgi:hypothetical protein